MAEAGKETRSATGIGTDVQSPLQNITTKTNLALRVWAGSAAALMLRRHYKRMACVIHEEKRRGGQARPRREAPSGPKNNGRVVWRKSARRLVAGWFMEIRCGRIAVVVNALARTLLLIFVLACNLAPIEWMPNPGPLGDLVRRTVADGVVGAYGL